MNILYKQLEKQRETSHRKVKRLETAYNNVERKRETYCRRIKRTNEYYRQKERIKDLGYRRRLRKTLSSMRLNQHRRNLLSMKIIKK